MMKVEFKPSYRAENKPENTHKNQDWIEDILFHMS